MYQLTAEGVIAGMSISRSASSSRALIEPPRHLVLTAEMKLPGVATLSFEIKPCADNQSMIVMTARFRSRGFLGIVYWYTVLPLHGIVFRGMLNGLVRRAQDAPIKALTRSR